MHPLDRFYALLAAGFVVAGVLLHAVLALALMVTLPAASRPDALCQALGAEAPCATEEIGHLKGYLTLIADDGTGRYQAVLFSRGTLHAVTLGTTDELALLERVNDPGTNWSDLVIPSTTWPTLRALAKVDDGVGVLRMARVMKGGVDGTGSAMASTAKLKGANRSGPTPMTRDGRVVIELNTHQAAQAPDDRPDEALYAITSLVQGGNVLTINMVDDTRGPPQFVMVTLFGDQRDAFAAAFQYAFDERWPVEIRRERGRRTTTATAFYVRLAP